MNEDLTPTLQEMLDNLRAKCTHKLSWKLITPTYTRCAACLQIIETRKS